MTTKAGASATSTAFFFSCLATASAVATVGIVGGRPRTTSSNGSTATGLKKWKPITRSGWARSAAISVTDNDEVLVASTQVSADVLLQRAKTSFLTDISSNTASRTKSQSA